MRNRLPSFKNARTFLKQVWTLARPYWWSEERWIARGLLGAVVGLNLGLVYINVLFNRWNNDFYNALQDQKAADFWRLIQYFSVLAAAYITIAVFRIYLQQMLEIRWRRWLSKIYYGDWLANRVYYRMELKDYGTDNPEQRIQDDVRDFTSTTLSLTVGLLREVVTLFSFLTILWTLSGPLTFAVTGRTVTIPGYMVWVAFLYALIGSWVVHKIGHPLIRVNFDQQRYEADFRYRMVRIRENAESVALYGGERDESRGLDGSFGNVWRNWWKYMKFYKRLIGYQSGYGQIAIIFPFLVAAPRYFSGAMRLGGLFQISSAFGQVQGALSWFIDVYGQFAGWNASVDRLLTFGQAIERVKEEIAGGDGIAVERNGRPALKLSRVTLALPTGRTLIDDLTGEIAAGDRVLLSGPSGAGKTTLFRTLAGIWPFGKGTVRIPADARILFLPQKPYLPIGVLRDVVCYPDAATAHTAAEVEEALSACRLGHLAPRLDESTNWSLALSPGEQQRLAFARVLLYKPTWLFLDEATSAVDEDTERHLYALLRQRLPGLTMISIAHRPGVAAYHEKRLRIDPETRQAAWEPITMPAAAGS